MPVHDRYARITPYELLLPDDGFDDRRFPAIEEEAKERGGTLADADGFTLLGEAGMILRELRGEEEDPALIRQHGALLFHAFHFWRQSRPLYLLRTGAARFLAETGPAHEDWSPSVPGAAGYIQLPQHLVWGPGGDEEPAESVDGIFWSLPDGETLSLLVALGVRRDRPGISVVPLPALPLRAAAPWATMRVRDKGEDFSSDLPGAELERLYTFQAGAEALKFVMRVFWYLDTFPETLGEEEVSPVEAPGKEGEEEPASAPRPSALPFRPIDLEGE